jgi:hypothetical protein
MAEPGLAQKRLREITFPFVVHRFYITGEHLHELTIRMN